MSLPPYTEDEPSRADVDAWRGLAVLEFGQNWCGWCQGAAPHVEAALRLAKAAEPELRHVRIADGKGRPLGRSFRVKLWPTLIVLRDGAEVARVVRPDDTGAIRAALGV